MNARKLQVALYWGAACGGCDVAVLDTDEFVLDLAQAADIRFWPIAVDGKYSDLEAMADGELDLALFNGAVRNSENEQVAKLLRAKSRILVAFGSCAHLGGIPGLANLTSKDDILATVYLGNPSLEPGNQTLPQPRTAVNGGALEIPTFYRRVYRLSDVVDVDYFVPGCPPAPAQVKAVLLAVVGGQLPPRRSVLGAGERALCDECPRAKSEKKVKRFYRPHQVVQDPQRCLLEQGILCMGPATRSGCGVRCPNSNQGCRGCYGPPPDVRDQGARFLSALASIVDSKDPTEIEEILAGLPDFASFAYRFSVPASSLQRSHRP
ncbi:MAG TPA: oxidoreductase [Vicinamibacteria bacterium]|nr:oxidoreductase [Vicinamibacteria bacterium]